MAVKALGNPLGNPLALIRSLPKQSIFSRIVIGSFTGAGTISGDTTTGTLFPPSGARFMRVAVVGGGGGSDNAVSGGGGGGCAASKIVSSMPISYFIGAGGIEAIGGNSTAVFGTYSLIGSGGGAGGVGAGGVGGDGIGGDYNYSGGAGAFGGADNGGGGAAGPFGNGTNGLAGSGSSGEVAVYGIDGWGICGGTGGASGCGGTGTGVYLQTSVANLNRVPTDFPWGRQNPNTTTGAGGEMGGGAGDDGIGAGGSGGMVVEWFY
jgi:hypothetical protein